MSGRRSELPSGLGVEVEAQLARLGEPAGGAELAAIAAAWAAAVGPAIAANAWPARLARDGTLVVHTSSSVWVDELRHLERKLRARLCDRVPRLRFAVGPVPEATLPPTGADGAPSVQRSIPKPERQDREAAERIARGIEDPALRDLVARAAAQSLAAARRRGPAGASDML